MYSKNQIIEEIKRIAIKLGVRSLKQDEFSKHSKISLSTVRYHFGAWNEAVKEAGLTPIDPKEIILKRELIDDNKLLLELVRLYKEYGKEPTQSLLNAKGEYSIKPYKDRWGNLKNAFLLAQKQFPGEFVKSPKQDNKSEEIISQDIKILPPTAKPQSTKKDRIVFGEPINFRGLRFAPINEQGVVYLFGMISQELGYLIESVRTEYPDCEGKRCFDKENNQWEHINIEFEYKSSQFREHGHNEEKCDLIVCWIHDWKDCPLEVLELRSVIKFLDSSGRSE